MSLSTIRAKIKAILEEVTDVGSKVYDYERWAKTWQEYLELFKSNGIIKGWTITRRATPEISKTPSSNVRTHTFIIHGFYSLDDSAASETTFQDIIENIATAFRSEITLGGTAFDCSPLQVDSVGAVMFGGVLCHFCELRLLVQEEEQWR